MKLKYVVGIIGSLLLIASAFTVGLIAKEFIISSKVDARYSFDTFSFMEDEGENQIEKLYEVVDSPPYRELPNLAAVHTFIRKNGETVRAKTVNDYLTEISNEKNQVYKITYHFYDQEIVITEDLDVDAKTSISINDKIVSEFPAQFALKDSVTLRYGNLGLVHRTDLKTGLDEVIVVQQKTAESWDVVSISQSGEVVKKSYNSIRELRVDPVMVNAVNLSGAHGQPIGYNNQLTLGYPSFIFPLFFPFITILLSFMMVLYTYKNWRKN